MFSVVCNQDFFYCCHFRSWWEPQYLLAWLLTRKANSWRSYKNWSECQTQKGKDWVINRKSRKEVKALQQTKLWKKCNGLNRNLINLRSEYFSKGLINGLMKKYKYLLIIKAKLLNMSASCIKWIDWWKDTIIHVNIYNIKTYGGNLFLKKREMFPNGFSVLYWQSSRKRNSSL